MFFLRGAQDENSPYFCTARLPCMDTLSGAVRLERVGIDRLPDNAAGHDGATGKSSACLRSGRTDRGTRVYVMRNRMFVEERS